jgi:16S rRNA (uracil1498-N3)-methyltransferase
VTPPLFLVPSLGSGDSIELTGAEAHHAATVKRLAPGEKVLLADGNGGLAHCIVAQSARDRVLLTVEAREVLPAPDPSFVVVQALPKGERADLAVEVLTELGVDEIVPWAASRSIAQWRGDKVDKGVAKWQRTALEAGKQSRRARIPVVSGLATTDAVSARIRSAALGLVLHEDATSSLDSVELPSSGEIVLVVGPEGGISDDESTAFVTAGASAVRLGPEVLRTSTAGAAALAVLSARVGRWG